MNRLQACSAAGPCACPSAYQHTLSPWIGRSCRLPPSCSNYTMQAILTHGCIKGILLGAWRIARCNPLGKWGYDPVPEPGRWRNPARKLQPAKLFENRHREYMNQISAGRASVPLSALALGDGRGRGSDPSGEGDAGRLKFASCDALHCGQRVLR